MTIHKRAEFRSTCPFCEEMIFEGDIIAFDEESEEWGHDYCVEDTLPEEEDEEEVNDYSPDSDFSSFIDDLNLSNQ